VIGLGGIGLRHESKAQLQRALASFRASLPPDARFEYDRAYPRFFAQGAGFDNARFINGPYKITAKLLTVNNPSGFIGTGLSFSRIHAENITVDGPIHGTIGDLHIHKLSLPAMNVEKRDLTALLYVSDIRFERSHLRALILDSDTLDCSTSLDEGSLDNFGSAEGDTLQLKNAKVSCRKTRSLRGLLPDAFFFRDGPVSLGADSLNDTGYDLTALIRMFEKRKKPDEKRSEPEKLRIASQKINHLVFRLGTISGEAAHSEETRRTEGTLTSSTYTVSQFALALPPESDAAVIFPNQIRIPVLNTQSSYDSKTHINTGTTHLSAPDAGIVDTSVTMQSMNGKSGKPGLRFIDVTFSYRDLGGIPLAQQRIATKMGRSVVDLKNDITSKLSLIGMIVPGLTPLPAYLTDPNGQTLTIRWHPEGGITVDALANYFLHDFSPTKPAAAWLSPPGLTTTIQ